MCYRGVRWLAEVSVARISLSETGRRVDVIVVGIAGERIGTVERFEIDKSGRLKWLVVKIATTLDTRKRIAAEHIRSIQNGIVSVAISATEVRSLVDDTQPSLDALWSDDPIFEQPNT
jgi:hypothetical protein